MSWRRSWCRGCVRVKGCEHQVVGVKGVGYEAQGVRGGASDR